MYANDQVLNGVLDIHAIIDRDVWWVRSRNTRQEISVAFFFRRYLGFRRRGRRCRERRRRCRRWMCPCTAIWWGRCDPPARIGGEDRPAIADTSGRFLGTAQTGGPKSNSQKPPSIRMKLNSAIWTRRRRVPLPLGLRLWHLNSFLKLINCFIPLRELVKHPASIQ